MTAGYDIELMTIRVKQAVQACDNLAKDREDIELTLGQQEAIRRLKDAAADIETAFTAT